MSTENNLKLLITSSDDYVLNQVQAVLQDNDLPYIEKNRELASYMKIIGYSNAYQTDIYVSENNFLLAKELINFLLIL